MSLIRSSSKAVLVGVLLTAACGKTTATPRDNGSAGVGFVASGGDSSGGERSISSGGNSDAGGGLLTSAGDSNAGGVSPASGNAAGEGGEVAPGGEAGAGGSPPVTKPPATSCTQIRVPTAKEEPIELRVVGTNRDGSLSGLWSVLGFCRQDSIRASTCYANVPVGGEGVTSLFKLQVRTPEADAWIDLNLPLRIETGGVPTHTSQVVWQGAAMESWLTGYHHEVGSWCGANRPEAGSNWIRGTIDIGALADDFVVPSNIVRFGLPIAQDSTAVGAKSVTDDPRFLTMWMNAVSGSADADRDGVADDEDLCLSRAGVNYPNRDDRSDVNADGTGDGCESWCFVPSDDELSKLYDFDGDGVDDTCDNAYTRFNPSQYVE